MLNVLKCSGCISVLLVCFVDKAKHFPNDPFEFIAYQAKSSEEQFTTLQFLCPECICLFVFWGEYILSSLLTSLKHKDTISMIQSCKSSN